MMDQTYMVMSYWWPWHWLLFALCVVLVVYPVGRILSRIGLSPIWSVLAFVPGINLLGLWLVALIDWPRDKRA